LKPGYKRTEVGVIPDDWEVVKFSDLMDFRNGVNADKGAYGKGIPFINVLEVITRPYLHISDIPGSVMLSKHVVDSYIVRNGDILFNRTSETQEEVGLASVYLGDENVVFGGFVIRGRPKSQLIDSIYPGYAFRSRALRSQIIAKGQGAIHVNIGQQNLSEVVAPLPPLPEQRVIAAALSDVDALLSGLDRLIAKKRDLKQAAMQQLLTGKLRLPGFTGEWERKRLGEIVSLIPSGIYGDEKPREDSLPRRVATTAHIDENNTWNNKEMSVRYFSFEQIRRYSPQEGDLIIVKSSGSAEKIQSGKIGFIEKENVGKCLFSNFLMLLRPFAIAPRFLYYYLCSYNVMKLLPMLVEASTYPNIRIDEYLNLEIPFPADEEQTAIATILSDMDAEIASLEQRRDKTCDLKQGMMQELLTGRIRLV